MRNRKLIAAAAMSAAVLGGAVIGATVGNPLVSGAEGSGTTTTTAAPKSGDSNKAPDHGDKGDGHGRGGLGMGLGFGGDEVLEPAAKALGMSTDDLRKELADGKSLAAIAKEKGVDRQDLIDALVKAADAKIDELKANLPDLIGKAVDATVPKGGPGGGFGGGFGRGGHGMGMGLDEAAKALGMSADDLRSELKDGKSLADVAKEKGVDKQKVIDAMVAAAKSRLDQQVKDGKVTQAEADQRLKDETDRITKQVDEGFPKGGPGGGDGAPGRPGN